MDKRRGVSKCLFKKDHRKTERCEAGSNEDKKWRGLIVSLVTHKNSIPIKQRKLPGRPCKSGTDHTETTLSFA